MGYLLNQFQFPSFFCRSAYCPKCFKNGRPQKNDLFMIIGSSKGEYWRLMCQRLIAPRDFGLTPHLFLYQHRFKTERDSYVNFRKVCLMDGCGITFFKNQEGKIEYFFNETDANQWTMATMPYRDAISLYTSFPNSGYELDWHYTENHKGAVISPDLDYLNLRRLYADKAKGKAVFTAR